MIERPLDFDPATGATETFQFDPATGNFNIIHSVDHQPVMEFAKVTRDSFRGPGGGRWGNKFMHHVAAIPLDIYNAKLKEYGPVGKNPEAWKKFLNDPDNKMFRTRPGRI